MAFYFPNQKTRQYSQQNSGDILGDIYVSKNLEFQKDGYLGLAQRTNAVYKHVSNVSGTTLVTSAVYDPSTSAYAFMSGDAVYIGNKTTLATTKDVSAGAPGATHDGDYFNNALYTIQVSTIKKRTAGVWSTLGIAPSTNNYHPVCLNERANELWYGDGNKVQRILTTDLHGTAITLPARYTVRWIVYSNSSVYIGATDTAGSRGKVYVVSASTTGSTADNLYDVNAPLALAGCKYKSGLAIINGAGQLMEFNGSGFTQIASFPVYNEVESLYNAYSISAGTSMLVSGVAPKGMVSIGEYIHINLAPTVYTTAAGYRRALDNMPGGVWTYDPQVGLYHHYSPSIYSDTTDYGQSQVITAGYIGLLADQNIVVTPPDASVASKLIFAAQIGDTDPSATSGRYYGIFSPITGENRGIFITTKFVSPATKDDYGILLKWRGMYDANDKIVVKYRNTERTGLPFVTSDEGSAGITWTSSTTFTSTITGFANAAVGDEIEISQGVGSGKTAYITAISYSNPTYTVTIGTALGTNTNKANLIVNNWLLAKTIDYTNTDGYDEVILTSGKWLQAKIELQGEGIQLEEMRVLNKTNKLDN
jgi:hypothetical protein